MKQICTKCKVEKNFEEFNKGTNLNGLNWKCKSCLSIYQKEYREKNKHKIKKYIEDNKDKLNKRQKEYDLKNKKKLDIYRKEYREANKEKAKQWRENNKEKIKKWREENKEKIRLKQREYREKNKERLKQNRQNNKNKINESLRDKRKSDPLFKLKANLRTRVHSLMVGKYEKNSSTEQLLGADFKTVKQHIESTFKEGMSWSNYGACKGDNCNEVWHIDHIVPLASAKTEQELIKLFHYKNLQALWAIDNIIKSDNI